MELMTKEDNPNGGAVILNGRQLILWSMAVAFFGVFFAIPLRKQTIIREKLKFPSGTATAQMISLLHQRPDPTVADSNTTKSNTTSSSGENIRYRRSRREDTEEDQPLIQHQQPLYTTTTTRPSNLSQQQYQQISEEFEYGWSLKLRGLIGSFTISSMYTILSYFVPAINAMPIFNWMSLGLIDFRAWEWYFTPSFSYIGQGIIMGLPTTLSMLLGCVIGWGILSPTAYYAGWAPGPVSDWKTGSKGWILWISLGVMIAESIVSLLVVLIRAITQYIAERNAPLYAEEESVMVVEEDEDAPAHLQVSKSVTVIGLVISTVLCICLVHVVFPGVMPIGMTLLAIIFAMLFSVLGVRALGETDLNPVSGIAKLAQVLGSGVMPGNILGNLIMGAIAEAGAQQAGDLMQDLKTGHLLKASPKAQFYGQMIGSLASVFIATGKISDNIYNMNPFWLTFLLNHRRLSSLQICIFYPWSRIPCPYSASLARYV
jgi:OPT family oligopeptide transporter